MLALKHDEHALRLELPDERIGNLGSQTLLHLRASGKEIDQTGKLGDTANLT